jgi:hypothetical protein
VNNRPLYIKIKPLLWENISLIFLGFLFLWANLEEPGISASHDHLAVHPPRLPAFRVLGENSSVCMPFLARRWPTGDEGEAEEEKRTGRMGEGIDGRASEGGRGECKKKKKEPDEKMGRYEILIGWRIFIGEMTGIMEMRAFIEGMEGNTDWGRRRDIGFDGWERSDAKKKRRQFFLFFSPHHRPPF